MGEKGSGKPEIRRALRRLEEWIDSTGAVARGSQAHADLAAIIEDCARAATGDGRMRTYDEIRDELHAKSMTTVARETGIRRQTLYSIRGGMTRNPGYRVMRALDLWLDGHAEEARHEIGRY